MRKCILTIVLVFAVCMNIMAQSDGFFTSNYTEYRENIWTSPMPLLPDHHGSLEDFKAEEVPAGCGLAVLSLLGLLYGRRKSKDNTFSA